MSSVPRGERSEGAEKFPPFRATTGHRAVDRRLERVERIREEIRRSALPLRVEDAIEKWAFELQRDPRTIRTDLRTILGEEHEGVRPFFTRMVLGKRLVGTVRSFRNREQRAYNGVLEAYGGDDA